MSDANPRGVWLTGVSLCCLVTWFFPTYAEALDGLIDTAAGNGSAAAEPSHGRASETPIAQPFGVEIGPGGALYITEVGNHRVRKLDLKTNQLTTVAGNGTKGYSGDGGPATSAQLNEPYEVRFDDAGNMYFVEMQNHLVRRVDAKTGIISTVAGSGERGYGGDGGLATEAKLSSPHSIALDGRGGLYIADIGNHRIRRVDLKSRQIETIAGTGERILPRDGQTASGKPILGPRALFITGDTLWIALREGHSVWNMPLSTGVLHHVAGSGKKGFSGDGGSAKKAELNGPKGIAVRAGVVYIVDTENQVIRAVHWQSDRIETIAGSGPAGRGMGGDDGPAIAAKMDRPHGVCVARDGTVYIGDTNNHRVRRVRAR